MEKKLKQEEESGILMESWLAWDPCVGVAVSDGEADYDED